MEHKSIANARKLRHPNAFGIKKVMRNILALQQSIRALTDDDAAATEFAHAKRYYSLFSTTPQALLAAARERPEFAFEEYEAMLALQCGVDIEAGADGAQRAVDRNYSSYVIELHGMEMDMGKGGGDASGAST